MQDIGLSRLQSLGDLDVILTDVKTLSFAKICDVRLDTIQGLAIPHNWVEPVREAGSRYCHGPIKVCPLCLAERHVALRFWRTVFAATCPIHDIELVSACSKCGTPITYFGTNPGFENMWWLEAWPACTKCLRAITGNRVAHPLLSRMTRAWFAALQGCGFCDYSAEDLLSLSCRLLRRFSVSLPYTTALAELQSLTHWPRHFAVASILNAIATNEFSDTEFNAALGLPFAPAELSRDILRAWAQGSTDGLVYTAYAANHELGLSKDISP